jgi:hypothetical protein
VGDAGRRQPWQVSQTRWTTHCVTSRDVGRRRGVGIRAC